jgi:phage tail tape-measure protein
MIDESEEEKVKAANGIGLPDSESRSYRHPLGAGIGAILAASTAGATGGAFVGPIGAIVGAVVGALAGGVGGRAVAELIDPANLESPLGDTYTTRVHTHSQPTKEADNDEEPPTNLDLTQTSRESWSHLDQTSKDLFAHIPPSSNVP